MILPTQVWLILEVWRYILAYHSYQIYLWPWPLMLDIEKLINLGIITTNVFSKFQSNPSMGCQKSIFAGELCNECIHQVWNKSKSWNIHMHKNYSKNQRADESENSLTSNTCQVFQRHIMNASIKFEANKHTVNSMSALCLEMSGNQLAN